MRRFAEENSFPILSPLCPIRDFEMEKNEGGRKGSRHYQFSVFVVVNGEQVLLFILHFMLTLSPGTRFPSARMC